MNGFDYIALAALVAAALRGYRQGLAVEFYRLFRMGVALIAGTSLYSIFSGMLTSVLNIKSGFADPAMFLGSSVLVWNLLKRLRLWMETWLRAKVTGKYQAVGGAVAAGLKTLIFIGAFTALFGMASWMPGHNAVARDSVTSKILQPFLPDR